MNGVRQLARIFSLALFLSLSACASQPKPTVARVTFDVQPGVNPDTRGRASPIVVRMYELTSLTAFDSADFFSVYERDKETLAGELVAREEFQLLPAEKRQFERRLQLTTRYVGVVAAFRDLERSQWRATVAVPAGASIAVGIRLDQGKISITAR